MCLCLLQAQDSSEVLKKQLKKVKKEKGDEAVHHKSNDENKKGATESTKEKYSKENEKVFFDFSAKQCRLLLKFWLERRLCQRGIEVFLIWISLNSGSF